MTDSAPALSIIIPAYNVEKYLPACLDSIIGQSFRDFEVLLIDDGSPDRCGEIGEEYAAKDPRIRVIHQPNGGLSRARNRGIEESRGKYLWFVDSDDYIHKECLSEIIGQLERDGLDSLVLSYYLDFEETGNLRHIKPKSLPSGLFSGAEYIESDYYEAFAWQKVTRAAIFKEHNLRFNEELQYEDVQIAPFLLRHTGRMAFAEFEDGAYYYRIRPDSITTTTNVEKQKKQIRMCYEIEESWRRAFDFDSADKGSYDYAVKNRLVKILHALLLSIVIRSSLSISEKNAVYRELIKRGILMKDLKSTFRLFKNEPTKQLVFYRALALSPRMFNIYTWIRDEIWSKMLGGYRS